MNDPLPDEARSETIRHGARLDLRLVPAALTCWVVTAAGILRPVGAVLAIVCVVAAGAVLAARHRIPGYADGLGAGLLAVCVVGAGFGFAITLRSDNVRDHPVAQRFGTVTEVTVTVTESPRSVGSGRVMFRANLNLLGTDEMGGRVTVFAAGLPFAAAAAGQPMRFRASIARPKRHDLTVATLTATGEPALGRMPATQRAAGSLRAGFAAAARDTLPADRAAMLPALVLGDMSAVTDVTAAQFRAAGLTHLTAVSGANVTIVCGTVLFAARLIGPRAAVALAAMTLAGFVVVVQPSASVLRAAVMGAIALLAILTSRHRQAIPALAGSVLVLMTVAPQLAVDVGFVLSVSATAALVVIAPVWSRRLVARGWPKPVADAVCIAAAAQLVTAPLIAGISGSVSLVAVGANLVVAPVIVPITVLGTAAAPLAVCWPGAAELLIRFTGPELWWLLGVTRWASGAPGATVPVPAGVGGVLVIGLAGVATVLVWRSRWRRGALVVALVCLVAWAIADLSVGRDTIVG